MSVPSFCSYHPRDGFPYHLPLIADKACIHKSHRSVANQDRVLSEGRSICLWLHTWAKHRGSKEKLAEMYVCNLTQCLPQNRTPYILSE